MRAYKYLSADDAIRDLAERRIKISEFADMNDPFELLGVRLSGPDHEGLSAAGMEEILRKHCHQTLGALCFSKSATNPLLWSHYADKHRGICLGFELSPDAPASEPKYVSSQQEASSVALINALPYARLPGDEAEKDPRFQEADQIIMSNLQTKFVGWEYEDEVRLITNKKTKDGKFYFYNFDAKLRPCEMRIGVRCTEPRSRIEGALKDYPEPIRIIRTRLDPANFQVIENNTTDSVA